MRIESIGIFGGAGFVGASLANAAVARGLRLRIFTRSRDRARQLWPLPNTRIIETDVYDEIEISRQLADCDAVINLAGILNEKGDNGAGFRRVHSDLTRTIIKACINAGVPRYLHMSALNADPFGPSYYLRSKGEAENAAMAAHDEGLPTTVFRPSVVFGANDDFFNRFARLLRIAPPLLPLACAGAKFQPVYVGDVGEAFLRALNDRSTFGGRYDLGGPEVKTLLEIVRYTAKLIDSRKIIVPMGPTMSKFLANILEYFPGKPFSRDNLRSASEDSICHRDNGLIELGIKPTAIGEVVPAYLGGIFERKRYYDFRSTSRRTP